jgi:hypothetical protein
MLDSKENFQIVQTVISGHIKLSISFDGVKDSFAATEGTSPLKI